MNEGFDLKIGGHPSLDLEILGKPEDVAVLPEKIPHIKPRLKVKIGDKVKIGSLLFEDKKDSSLKFLSPGGGEVSEINFGPRRVIQTIVIHLDKKEKHEKFNVINEEQLRAISREKIVSAMKNGGLWPFIRSLPYRKIADSEKRPSEIVINLSNKEPFAPHPNVYLNGTEDLFNFGLTILKRLAGKIVITTFDKRHVIEKKSGLVEIRYYNGAYPDGDPGVYVYFNGSKKNRNISWFIDGQDVLSIARFFQNGIYPIERVMVLAGELATERKHFKTRAGIPVELMADGRINENHSPEFIVGGLFRGFKNNSAYVGLYENSVILINRGDHEEPFGFLRAGYSKPSLSNSFLSVFNHSGLSVDCGVHGELRACINCGYCSKVCAVDILPQFLFKCLEADALEEALSHGLLDCVECGLCTYVCPSKIELHSSFKMAKRLYHEEMS